MNVNMLSKQVFFTACCLLSVAAHAGENDNKLSGISKLLNTRTYVRMDKDATCKANDPEHTVLKTWANKISFENGQVLVWGKVCNDSPESISFVEAGKSLYISADLKRIVYKNEVLRYYKDAPKLCDGGQWCPVEAAKP